MDSNIIKTLDSSYKEHSNSYIDFGAHLKSVSDAFDDTKSLTDVLNQFRLMSEEYQEFTRDRNITVTSGPADYRHADEESQIMLRQRLQNVECMVMNSIYDNAGFIYNWNNIWLHSDLMHYQLAKYNWFRQMQYLEQSKIYS